MQLTAPPVIYCAAVNSCLSITSSERENVCNFQYLLITLARKGIFLDDHDDMVITEAILTTQHPFSMVSIICSEHVWFSLSFYYTLVGASNHD